jgi:predicted protein tyrosine phosphatase
MSNFLMNRLANCHNQFQGEYKKVLCVCSAGLLRSPTTAVILSQKPYNFNTRAAGLMEDFALIPVDKVLLEWADEIVCMNTEQEKQLRKIAKKNCPVICLNIPDSYAYRDPKLVKLIKKNYNAALENKK